MSKAIRKILKSPEMDNKIFVHPLTNQPTEAWKQIFSQQKLIKVNVKPPTTPVDDKKVRFVCMADTHSLIHNIKFNIPDGDVFIHAGDFSKCGHKDEVTSFNKWLETLPHKHKIVIAGNHELSFDPSIAHLFKRKIYNARHTENSIDDLDNDDEIPNYGKKSGSIKDAISTVNIREYLTNCTYLEDTEICIYGLKIYGTPWQPKFGNGAFNLERGEECLAKWDLIPDDVDILITHTPPLGHGDLVCNGIRAGCVELLSTVQKRVKPKYHIFGHIHEGYGISSDGKIIFINASTCDINFIPNNLPVVFDVPLPKGIKK